MAVRTDGGRSVTFSHFPRDLVQSVCALHKHEAFALSRHVLRPCHSRNLDVARRICNYRLTRARRVVECAFGIVCSKWRVFHFAIDVCPDFYDVTVTTSCILHSFFGQRDGVQFHDTLKQCPVESIQTVGAIRNVTGTDMGRRVQGAGICLLGAPLGSLAGG